MRRSQRGATLAEVLVYSFLAALVGGMMLQLLNQYGDLSSFFNQRSAVNSQTLVLFRNVGLNALQSNAKGITVSADQSKLVFQKIEGVTGSGLTLWSPDCTVLWYDSATNKVSMGELTLSALGIAHNPELAATLSESNIDQAITATSSPLTMAEGLGNFTVSRPSPKELKLELEFQNNAIGGGQQTYQRQRTFFLMTDGEL